MNTALTNTDRLVIRPLNSKDDLQELTFLLNKAYRNLSNQGLNYVAAHQGKKTTEKRIAKGKCFVAVLDDKLVGTICYYPKHKGDRHEWYRKSFVAKYGQFAVDPQLQALGIGGKLVDFVEQLALRDGFTEIAIDTAERATDLVRFYAKRGYRHIAFANWKETNYTSVLMSKKLRAYQPVESLFSTIRSFLNSILA